MNEPPKQTGPGDVAPVTTVEALFTKSGLFRVVHADGAFGGIAPNGLIRMALYSEGNPFPESITYDLQGNNLIEKQRSKQPPLGTIIRELEVDVVMNIRVARSLRNWLDDKIKQLEQAEQAARTPANS
jgi:hypothetical protein